MKELSSNARRVALGPVLALLVAASAAASQSPYTSFQERDIKALSPEQIADYEAGQGMGFALAAELNGYPGPKHVLELQGPLELTESQLQSTEKVFAQMRQAAQDLGRQIVEQERELDRLFVHHSIDGEGLNAQILRIAQLQGKLRAAHLQAHLEMMEVLNEDQIRRYIELRGYHAGEHQGHDPAAHHGGHH